MLQDCLRPHENRFRGNAKPSGMTRQNNREMLVSYKFYNESAEIDGQGAIFAVHYGSGNAMHIDSKAAVWTLKP